MQSEVWATQVISQGPAYPTLAAFALPQPPGMSVQIAGCVAKDSHNKFCDDCKEH